MARQLDVENKRPLIQLLRPSRKEMECGEQWLMGVINSSLQFDCCLVIKSLQCFA